MSVLDSKFDVVKGHPGESSTFNESFKPASGYTPAEGDIVSLVTSAEGVRIELASLQRLDNLATGSVTAFRDALVPILADIPHTWLVVSGMQADTDFDGVFTGKAVCIAGAYMMKTTNFNVSDTYVLGGPVTVDSGVIRSNPFSSQTHVKYGEVVEDNQPGTGDDTLVIAVNV